MTIGDMLASAVCLNALPESYHMTSENLHGLPDVCWTMIKETLIAKSVRLSYETSSRLDIKKGKETLKGGDEDYIAFLANAMESPYEAYSAFMVDDDADLMRDETEDISHRSLVTVSSPFIEDGHSLIGSLDSGATRMFVKPSSLVQDLDDSIQKTVSLADGFSIRTIGRGTINGMEVHVGPFNSNLISCAVLLQHGIVPVLSLTDPHLIRAATGERFGEVQYFPGEGFKAKIPIVKFPDKSVPFSTSIVGLFCSGSKTKKGERSSDLGYHNRYAIDDYSSPGQSASHQDFKQPEAASLTISLWRGVSKLLG